MDLPSLLRCALIGVENVLRIQTLGNRLPDVVGSTIVRPAEARLEDPADFVGSLHEKAETGKRIGRAEALRLWRDASDDDLRVLAGAARARFHRTDEATYTIMRIVNFTNVCVAKCDYCAFYVLPGNRRGYVMKREDVFAKIDELIALGGDLFGFNGGFNPALPLDYYCGLFEGIRSKYRDRIEFYGLTVAEFLYLADNAGLALDETARRLHDAGLLWITGGGAEILTEDFRRRHSAFKYTVADFFEAQRAILRAGMRTTATMVIGFDETIEERIEHLERIRDFQDETSGGQFSLLAWTYKPHDTALGGVEVTPREYLRHIALCRIFLDNFNHIRASVLTQNENAFEALRYGADDFDLPFEDEVTQKAGATIERDFEKLLAIPRAMGFKVSYRRTERAGR